MAIGHPCTPNCGRLGCYFALSGRKVRHCLYAFASFNSLFVNVYSAKFDPAKAFEVLVTLWAASKYSTIRHFVGELGNFKALKEEKESSAFAVFADRQQAKIDGAGKIQLKKHKGERRLFLIQTKRAEPHQATQTKKEVMEVVAWAFLQQHNSCDALFFIIFLLRGFL